MLIKNSNAVVETGPVLKGFWLAMPSGLLCYYVTTCNGREPIKADPTGHVQISDSQQKYRPPKFNLIL